jgi:formylglycine-generating enzyme required for sulfatase activity
MRLLIFTILSFLLVFGAGCSKDENKSSGDDAPVSQTDESAQEPAKSVEKVVPVTLSPEDQEKAKLAPEGMVFIKGGCFIMGNDYAQEDEKPEHEVCVDDFFMDKFEVTQAKWEKVTGYNPSKIINPDHPLEQVNYIEVQEYLEKSECRLPTEAEWEYAARGGADSRYYWGNMIDESYTWYEDNSKETTHPVGQKLPNQYGLHDMMGNVWEWTNDWYEPYYQIREKKNPQGPETGKYRVIRGGAFDSSAGALRITNRIWLHPKNRVFPKVTTYGQAINEVYNYIGFRCAQSIPATATESAK